MRHCPIWSSLCIARLLLGAVLLVSGVAKVISPHDAASLVIQALPLLSVQVFGIALDSLQATHRFVIDRGLVYPVFVPDMPASFASVASVRFVPQTVLRTPDGMVAHSWPGMMSDSLSSVVRSTARIYDHQHH
jgi:hypothetical protein